MLKLPNIPVLLVGFNRPWETEQTIAGLAEFEPAYLYVSLDGPRATHPEDSVRIEEVCAVIQAGVKWDCRLTFFRNDYNLGARRHLTQAVSMVLEQSESVLVVEDDVILGVEFNTFCQELLVRYQDDPEIMAICSWTGYPPHDPPVSPYSYYLSRYFYPSGWATWRRAWQHWNGEMPSFTARDVRGVMKRASILPLVARRWWSRIYQRSANDRHLWSYAWQYAIWQQKGMVVVPTRYLSSNVGFNERATLTQDSSHFLASLQVEASAGRMAHPQLIERSAILDMESDRKMRGIGWKLEAKLLIVELARRLGLHVGTNRRTSEN